MGAAGRGRGLPSPTPRNVTLESCPTKCICKEPATSELPRTCASVGEGRGLSGELSRRGPGGVSRERPQAVSDGSSPCCTRSTLRWGGQEGLSQVQGPSWGPMLALNLASSQERGRAPSAGPRGGRLRADLPLGNVCQEGSTPEIPTPPHFLWVPGSPTASWLL